jgi:hypothetical protein
MTRMHSKDKTSYGILMTLAGGLTLSACNQGSIQEPWTGSDPQWKQSHFASQTPDEALRERAALTQIDR